MLFLFLPLQLLLSQDRWIQVPNPASLSNTFEVFGETYYKAPIELLQISKKYSDIGLWELNEAFAVQVVYCRDELGIPMDKLNVD